MRCHKVYDSLLASEEPGAPPPEVQHHLARCPNCRRLHQRLVRLGREVRDMPRPGESPTARQQLLRQLDRLPPPALVPPAIQPMRRPRLGFKAWASLVAAAVLVGLGISTFLTDREGPHDPVAVKPSQPEIGPVPAGVALTDRLVESDLRLAEVVAPTEQVQTLLGMAADLRAEACRQAGQGDRAELARIGGLYEQVVGRGVVGRAAALPEAEKKVTLPRIARQLREETGAVEQAAGQTPGVAKELRALGRVATGAAERLTAGLPPAPVTTPKTNNELKLEGALVLHGLRLAETPDPLRRADCCTDIADALVQTILEASAAGKADRTTHLGRHLGAIMDRGVAANLTRLPADEAAGPRRVEFERVSRRAAAATAMLERNLERAPASARPGLQRALEASSHGRERAMQAGRGKGKGKGQGMGKDKGKGKPHGPPGKEKSFVPPGLRKKLQGEAPVAERSR